MNSPHSLRRLSVLIVVVAFAIRLGATVALRDLNAGPSEEPVGADGVEYDALGYQVALGNGYVTDAGLPTSFRAPGFPFFLAALYRFFGHNYVVAHVAFCVWGAVGCLLTYLVARELLSDRDARLTALLGIFYFPHIYYSTAFFSETMFATCLTLSVWLILCAMRLGDQRLIAGAGAALGLAALTRPVALLAAPLLFGVLLIPGVQNRRWTLFPPIVLTLGVVSVVLPWTMRNYTVHGRTVLIATNGGSTFYGSNNDIVLNDPSNRGFWVSTRRLPSRDLIEATPDEVSHDKLEWDLGKQWVRSHLSSMPRLTVYKLMRLVLPDLQSGNKASIALKLVTYAPFLVLISLGVAKCLWQWRVYSTTKWLVFHSATGATTVLNAIIFYGCARFLNAAAPLLMIYAGIGISVVVAASNHGRLRNASLKGSSPRAMGICP